MSYRLTAVIEKDEDGYYAYCPDLAGCHEQPKLTAKEAEKLLLQARFQLIRVEG